MLQTDQREPGTNKLTDLKTPIRIELPSGFTLQHDAPATRIPPPIRKTLEDYRATRKPSDLSAFPWEVKKAAEQARQQELADLDAFLAGPIPPVPINWTILPRADVSDTWPVTVTLGQDRLTLPVTLGDRRPPSPDIVQNDPGRHLVSLKAVYTAPPRKPTFFAPFGFLGRSRLAYWDIGWLGLYLLAYIPLMFLLRWALRIA